MKKIISSIAVCSLTLGILASCGKQEPAEKEKKSADITGKWSIDSLDNETIQNGGIIFSDGKGSVYTDSSKVLHFNDEGLAIGDNSTNMTTLSKDYFKEDGKQLTIDISGMEMLVMTKIVEGEGYDGTYSLDGGLFYDQIVEGMSKGDEKMPEDIDISLVFDGDSSEVVFNDLFEYEVKGKEIKLTGYSAIMDITNDGGTAEYSIDGDKLTIKGPNKSETFTRVK